jgi:mono/diheme cytochrome c family protein
VRFPIGVICLFAIVPLGLLISRASSQPLVVFTAAQVRSGQAVYPQQCGACHGPDMEGGSGPALTGVPEQRLFWRDAE